jgi:hypothetical protein
MTAWRAMPPPRGTVVFVGGRVLLFSTRCARPTTRGLARPFRPLAWTAEAQAR